MTSSTAICKQLIELALRTDLSVRITPRMIPEKNHSTRILDKNSFVYLDVVQDPEEGAVWEWEYRGIK